MRGARRNAGKNMKCQIRADWGAYKNTIEEWIAKTEKLSLVKRLWENDSALWTRDPKAQAEIKSRLGWLLAPKDIASSIEELIAFARQVKESGVTHLVLLGMGGSSLAPEVFQTVFGNAQGFPGLIVLDSTDPGRVSDVQNKIDLAKTLFIVASKSGGTIELVSAFKYFFEKVKSINSDKPGEQFIAITDPASPLEALARKLGFKKTFLTPANVGGRFSALTYFGLVPAALIGLDIKKLLDKTYEMMADCSAETPAQENPALLLGIAMAVLSEEGRDKVTLLTTQELEPFGDWIEQLVAESSGKEGIGIVPVVREPLGEIGRYGKDRFFVGLLPGGEPSDEIEKRLVSLAAKKHPTVTIPINETADLAGQFFLWEMATAIACALLKINAFDQPDVQAAKDKTKSLLKVIEAKGQLAEKNAATKPADFFGDLTPGDYVGILAFLPDRPLVKGVLVELQAAIRDFSKNAVTVGIGPRYLHSTGQLHKGGPNSGAFILITAKPAQDLPIPGEKYSFGQLEFAQAMGDYETLSSKERRVIHLALEDASDKGMESLRASIQKAIAVWEMP